MSKTSKRHDEFFKRVFLDKENVASFIRGGLPPSIKYKTETLSLELDTNTYTDKHLREHLSDIVYTCNYGGEVKHNIALLFEHKSYLPDIPHIQLGRYIINYHEATHKQEKKLKQILPILFYHGSEKLEYKPFKDEFEHYADELHDYQLNFRYILFNLKEFTENEIKEGFDSLKLQIALMVMRNIFDVERLESNIKTIFAELDKLLSTDDGQQFFDTLLFYVLENSRINEEKFIEEISNINIQGGKKAMTTAERLRKEGYKLGKQEGKFEGYEKGVHNSKRLLAIKSFKQGLNDNIVAIITGLLENEVAILRAEYEKKGDKLIAEIEAMQL